MKATPTPTRMILIVKLISLNRNETTSFWMNKII